MPSVALVESESADMKKKSVEKLESADMEENCSSAEKKSSKKEKKSSKKTKLASEPDPENSNSTSLVKKKKEKKRKALESDAGGDNEDKSETSTEMGEPMNNSGKKKKKKMRLEEGHEEEEEEKEENPNAVSNFPISEPLREALKARGIESLFPIQATTFNTVFDGADLVGRARTGQVWMLLFKLGSCVLLLYSLMVVINCLYHKLLLV